MTFSPNEKEISKVLKEFEVLLEGDVEIMPMKESQLLWEKRSEPMINDSHLPLIWMVPNLRVGEGTLQPTKGKPPIKVPSGESIWLK